MLTVAQKDKILRTKRYEAARSHLWTFYTQAWSTIDSAPLQDNWHIGLICDHLQAQFEGEPLLKKMVISIQPRVSKTSLTSICYPAWCWLNNPTMRFLCISHTEELAEDIAGRARDLITSQWYRYWTHEQNLFRLRADSNKISKYANTEKGGRLSVGVDSSIQGFGGDCIIYDDPNSVKDIWSQARQQSVINFHKVSIRNRANTSKTTWVLVQQRLGTKDFTQYIMSEKGWFHLIIPTEYTKHYTFKSPIGRNDPRKKDGELVWPERFDKEFYEEEKKNQWVWQSIYQQNPVNLDGNTIKKDWLKYSNAQPESDYYDQIILSIDLAIEETDTADYSAFLVIGQKTDPSNPFKSLFYIHEWHKDKLSFPDIVKKVQELTLKYKKSGTAFSRIIEKKGIGKALLDVLSKNEDTTDIIPVVPSKSKLERLLSVQMLFINDCVIFPNPENAPTIQGVIDELLAFPKGEHDDYVDALSQGLNWLFLNQRGLSTNVYIPSSDNTEISLFSVSSGTDFSTVNPFRQTDNTTTLKKLFK